MTEAAGKVLVVDDEPQIRRFLRLGLEGHGYAVLEAATGEAALRLAVTQPPDLVVLDLGLPDRDGFEVLGALREWSRVPVFVLSVRSREVEKVRAFDLGADDYVVKPFSVRELLARVEAVLRRAPRELHAPSTIALGDGRTIDLARREIRTAKGARTEISEREADLVRYLAAHSDRAVPREELLSRVWGLDARGMTTRTIDMHVARLREKLGDDPTNPAVLLTVRGKGYMFRAE
jgi:DNA-binding response OmpR family regulator